MPSAPFPRYLLLGIAVLIGLAGMAATLGGFGLPLNIYDEGLILTNAKLILSGAAPVRDFYSNYPPGIFLILAGLWKLCGVSIGLARLLGFVIHLSLAALVGRIAGRIAGRRFSLLAGGLVLLWISPLGVIPYAWMAALDAAYAGIELALIAREHGQAWALALCGFSLGALSGLRHDLFIYDCVVLAAFAAGWKIIRRPTPLNAPGVRAGLALLGFTIPAALVWGPTIARAGLGLVARDLVFDQVRYVLPARALPLPALLELVRPESWPLPLPAALADWYPGAAALALLGPLLLIAGTMRAGPWGIRDRAALLLTGALAIAVLPQLLGRSDQEHCLYTVAPALTLAAALIEARVRRPHPTWRRTGAMLVAVLALWLPVRSLAPSFANLGGLSLPSFNDHPGDASAEDLASREQVLTLLAQQTRPGEGIFVGNDQHRLVTWNDVSLYYLADRPGVTRYLQFDPNIVTRAEVQQQMVRDLDRKQVRIAVLYQGGYRAERNQSVRLGSDLLDEYLRTHYEVLAQTGRYTVLRRSAPR